jgi:hypothetical protein
MKQWIVSLLLMFFVPALTACGTRATPTPTPAPSEAAGTIEDQTSLVAALEAAGATVELGEPVTQEFFAVEGQIIKVNGQDVQVFEYDSPEAMQSDAALVSPDGGTIGTSSVMWMDAPHFYKSGKIIVLYVGSDEVTVSLLDQTLGPQFAGQ